MSISQTLAGFDGSLPLDRACTIPSAWYFDSEVADLERRCVFANTWQMVGRADQVAKPGDFLTADVAGEPILVVRGEDGVLRAFFNVCRHRAARVAIEPCGHATKLRCRYHGWTYDLAGKLRGVPEFDGVADFERKDNGLTSAAVDAWGPLVFVHLGEARASQRLVLGEHLHPLPERCEGLGVEHLKFFERREYVLDCNWKVFCDNYLDGGYHVNTIHPGLSGVLDYSGYHTDIAGNTSVQVSPMKKAAPAPLSPSGGEGSGVRGAKPQMPQPSHPKPHPQGGEGEDMVASVRTGDTAYYWWIFPNLMINLYQGVMDTNLVLPLGPNRCRVLFNFYFENVEGDEARRFNAQSIAVGHQIQQEDVDICADVQRGLASRAFDTGRFSVRREAGVHHFHQLLAKALSAKS